MEKEDELNGKVKEPTLSVMQCHGELWCQQHSAKSATSQYDAMQYMVDYGVSAI